MNDLPPSVCRLLSEHISSVGQLEMLLLLHGAPDREWQADEVSRALYTSEETVAGHMAAFQQRGFLVLAGGEPPRYKYEPRSTDLKDAVVQLEQMYKERRVAVINFIYSAPVDKVRTFADAFRLRRNP